MKKVLSILLVATMLLGAVAAFSSCGKKAKYTVGICQLAEHPALDAATQGFIDVLKAEFGDDVKILSDNAGGKAETCTTIVNNFVSRKVDLIMANATDALTAAANGTKTIPVLGTSVTDYGSALGLKDFDGTVLGGNVSGTSDKADLVQQANMILELFPETKKVAILFSSSEANSRFQVDVVKATLEAQGITVKESSFSDTTDVLAVATQAATEADVIFIPTDNAAATSASAIDGVIGNTPVIAGEESICKACGVATLSISYYALGQQTGRMAVKILKGEANISEMPIEHASFVKMFNERKCNQLGINTDNLIANGYVAIEED